jgi:ATP-dependent Clp protease ATP-binding subunit ClpA
MPWSPHSSKPSGEFYLTVVVSHGRCVCFLLQVLDECVVRVICVCDCQGCYRQQLGPCEAPQASAATKAAKIAIPGRKASQETDHHERDEISMGEILADACPFLCGFCSQDSLMSRFEAGQIHPREVEKELRAGLSPLVLHQPLAVDTTVAALIGRLSGYDDAKPLVLTWVGSSGVGKDTLLDALISVLWGFDQSHDDWANVCCNVDLNQYSHKDTASGLVGTSSGFVDAGNPGILPGFFSRIMLREKNPKVRISGVLSLNEVDKADKSILTQLMEVFDRGRLRTMAGKTKQTPYLMTKLVIVSRMNTASKLFQDPTSRWSWTDTIRHKVQAKLLKSVCGGRESMLGRLGSVTPFFSFAADAVFDLLNSTAERLPIRFHKGAASDWPNDVSISFDASATGYFWRFGYDHLSGYRSIESNCVNPHVKKMVVEAAMSKLLADKDRLVLSVSAGNNGAVTLSLCRNSNGSLTTIQQSRIALVSLSACVCARA